MYTKEQIENTVKEKGYKWFESGNYDVNIVGVRSTGKKITNKFDDYITISFKLDGVWQFYCWNATTDPGAYYMQKKLLSTKGCARLKPGQYRGSHRIGMHQSKYEALCQQKVVDVFRDKNLDNNYDETSIESGLFGINLHKAGTDSLNVDNFSAGCQVFKRVKDFNEFMLICNKAKSLYGNSFTYTLITQEDIKK